MEKINLLEYINEKYKNSNKEVWNFKKEILKENFAQEKITELHIHKILYFLFGFFWKEYKKELFNANFEAWKYGPIEIDFRNKKNLEKLEIFINNNELKFLDKIIFNLLKYDVWNLVDESHKTLPWLENYIEGEIHSMIKIENIKKYFESLQ